MNSEAIREADSYRFEDFVEGDPELLKAAQREIVSIVDGNGMRYVLCTCDVFEHEKQKAVCAAIS